MSRFPEDFITEIIEYECDDCGEVFPTKRRSITALSGTIIKMQSSNGWEEAQELSQEIGEK